MLMNGSKMVYGVGLSLWTLLAVAGSGCGNSSQGSHGRYIPDRELARQALETALAAWQRGEPAAKIESASPKIEVVDTKRMKGQKLTKYEILKEESGDGARW